MTALPCISVSVPCFVKNDYYSSLTAGVSAIMLLLNSEYCAAPTHKAAQQKESISELLGALTSLLFFGLIILITIISRARGGGYKYFVTSFRVA